MKTASTLLCGTFFAGSLLTFPAWADPLHPTIGAEDLKKRACHKLAPPFESQDSFAPSSESQNPESDDEGRIIGGLISFVDAVSAGGTFTLEQREAAWLLYNIYENKIIGDADKVNHYTHTSFGYQEEETPPTLGIIGTTHKWRVLYVPPRSIEALLCFLIPYSAGTLSYMSTDRWNRKSVVGLSVMAAASFGAITHTVSMSATQTYIHSLRHRFAEQS